MELLGKGSSAVVRSLLDFLLQKTSRLPVPRTGEYGLLVPSRTTACLQNWTVSRPRRIFESDFEAPQQVISKYFFLRARAERTLVLSSIKSGQSEAREKILGRGVVLPSSPTFSAPNETARAVLTARTTFSQ